MTVREFILSNAVEICVPKPGSGDPKYGSGYRIGGRLVLTAKHLIEAVDSCKVRLKSIGEVDAKVVWISSDSDIDVALVELPKTVKACDAVKFGRLPTVNTSESVDFLFYGWPSWGFTNERGRVRSGGRESYGAIRLANTSPDRLLVLEVTNPLEAGSSEKTSIWEGASGAAIICKGCVVAVQSQHPNPVQPAYLEAAPLAKIYENDDWRKLLSEHGINPEPQSIQLNSRPGRTNFSISSTGSGGHPTNIVDLFWHLDYKRQERAFEDALAEQGDCIAFSISAPCDTTQRWILNRLIRKIENRENALVVPTMGLRKHPMRHDFQHFWIELSKQFGTQPSKEEVLKSLCQTNIDCPVILTIHDFRQFDPIQKQIMQDFWEPLAAEIGSNSRRSERSRVVLFFVDECCPKYESDYIVKLDPLDGILQQDVKNWLNSNPVAQCWQSRFGDGLVKDLIKYEFSKEEWNWTDPWLILDKMCSKFEFDGRTIDIFELEHGIVDLEEAWEWAS